MNAATMTAKRSSRLETLVACKWVRNIVTDDEHSKYEQFIKNSMRSVQVSKPNGTFEIVERKIPETGDGKVRIKVGRIYQET